PGARDDAGDSADPRRAPAARQRARGAGRHAGPAGPGRTRCAAGPGRRPGGRGGPAPRPPPRPWPAPTAPRRGFHPGPRPRGAGVAPGLTDGGPGPPGAAGAGRGGGPRPPPQGAAAAGPPQPGVAVPPQPGIAVADRVWELTRTATELRARLGKAGDCPPELAEATAALQELAGRLVPPGQAEARRADLWQLQAGLPATIQAAHGGPYLVTNVPRLIDYLGAESRPAPQLALCRCGQSAIKPWCDGSCARVGFSDAKDPKRVPDRRDSHPGQELTIFDNRGICQHSGL